MSMLRWLSVALLTLAGTSALQAQTASFSALGLTALFGQEASNQVRRLEGCLDLPAAEESEEVEHLPAAKRCDISLMPGFVPECLNCWKEQWSRGNYQEATLLATLACRLDPTNVIAQHALVISELMQGLSAHSEPCGGIAGPCFTPAFVPVTKPVGSANACTTFSGITIKSPTTLGNQLTLVNGQFTPFGQINSQFQGVQAITGLTPAGTLTCDLGIITASKECCAEAGCCAATSAAKTCSACQSSQKVQQDIAALLTSLKQLQAEFTAKQTGQCAACATSCACATKSDCCCAKGVQTQTKACPSQACCPAQQASAAVAIKGGCAPACSSCPLTGFMEMNGVVTVVPAPFVMTNGDCVSSFLGEIQSFLSAPMPAPVCARAPIVVASPSIYVSSSTMPPAPPQGCASRNAQVYFPWGQPTPPPAPEYLQVPPSAFAPGLPRSLPSPAQVVRDLECVRTAAMNQAMVGAVQQDSPVQAVAKHNCHLVTPHLEAHCERLTSAGNADHIVLEGDVHLVCNRNGQTIRIQGQRVVVHLADGTFTVESMPEFRQPAPAARVGTLVKPNVYFQRAPSAVPAAYWELARPVVRPAETVPDDEAQD